MIFGKETQYPSDPEELFQSERALAEDEDEVDEDDEDDEDDKDDDDSLLPETPMPDTQPETSNRRSQSQTVPI